MRKAMLILAVATMFMFVSFAGAQDCGKCPMKTQCDPSKVQETKKTDDQDPMVYVKKDDKTYHLKDCKIVKAAAADTFKPIKLSEAVKLEMKPCTECKPPVVKVETPQKNQ